MYVLAITNIARKKRCKNFTENVNEIAQKLLNLVLNIEFIVGPNYLLWTWGEGLF